MKIDFVKHRKIFFLITAAVLVLGVVCMILRGFNVDTDFTGGTTMQIDIGRELNAAELDAVKKLAEDAMGAPVSGVQKAGAAADEVLLKMKEIDSETREKVFHAIADAYSLGEEALLNVTNVGASMSDDLRQAAFVSAVIAIVLMLVYIAFRFRFTSALAAVICLMHDLAIMFIAYSLFQIPMQSTMIAAMLTILGYSINATIIIFDQIREGRRLNPKAEFGEIVTAAIASTLNRSINTTITTLLTIGMIFIFGVDSIRDFALPLIVGILAGLYSSVCLAGNVWLVLEDAFARLRTKKNG